jgi:hypothetical protein
MLLDVASFLILGCLGVCFQAVPPYRCTRVGWVGTACAVAAFFLVRVATDAGTGLDMAAAFLLIGVVLTVGRELLVTRAWPAGTFVAAVAIVTATGAYLRAERLNDLLRAEDRPVLQADAAYYRQQALKTANPFAAGEKSPLWPALNAPLVRWLSDGDLGLRLGSWAFGILMVPAVALGVGRLFERVVGIAVAGTLAMDSWLIELCTEGLREELGVCLWMAVLVLLFGRTGFSWRRVVGAGVVSGVLLLLRNTDAPVLMILVAYGLIRARTPALRVAVGLALPLIVVAPFYVNQWRAHGDAFYLEKRDARYHANMEFRGRQAPAGLTMPTDEEYARDLYAGEPLSPAAYLFKYHTLRELAAGQWTGLKLAITGQYFTGVIGWFGLICAAGLLATFLRAEQRFAGIFVAGSVLGIRAHLIATGPSFEARHLLAVMVVWLAAGWWLIAAGARAGMARWAVSRPERERGREGDGETERRKNERSCPQRK